HVGKKQISLIGIGVGGAMASNIAQLVLSYYLLFGDAALLIATPFLAVGLISSLILGIFAHQFVTQSRWYQRYL
ncbi:MAG: Gx transporter family protein, partial [Sphaerochaetaceae bacterium]